ncbi:hypothetical protein [Cupriavidus basilensis]|jgi:hypothetical protein|nr:MAG TPA: hypothetical protein [Inoviridae sp.]
MSENKFANVGDNTWINVAHIGKVTIKPEYQDIPEDRQQRRTTTLTIHAVDGTPLYSTTTTVVYGNDADPKAVVRDNSYFEKIKQALGLPAFPSDLGDATKA